MPIDYSKWDHIEDDSDSDSNNNDDNDNGVGVNNQYQYGPANVTRLDSPSSVTFGGNGGSSHPTVTATTAALAGAATSTPATTKPTTSKLPSTSTSTFNDDDITQQHDQQFKLWTEKGGYTTIPVVDSHRPAQQQQQQPRPNGTNVPNHRKLFWSQDRYSVTIRIELFNDESSKVASVSVDGILPYTDRFTATTTPTTTKPRLCCIASLANKTNNTQPSPTRIIVDDDLPYPVHVSEEDEDQDNDNDERQNAIDWTIVRRRTTTTTKGKEAGTGGVLNGDDDNEEGDRRYIEITLYKAVPMYGMFVWWRRCLMQCPEMDTNVNEQQQLSGEVTGDVNNSHNNNNNNKNNDTSSNNEKFLQAWKEAHEIFKQNKKDEREKS